ncbi:MAG: non-hydrolyzing UDP-N-acetylglucosamine 2-epimerase [Spirochaetales bacterium]
METDILIVVGARPNFMKAAPLYRALASRGYTVKLVHTGQHYDANMSDVFFEQLQLPRPDEYLGVGGGTHAEQTANIMVAFEKVLAQATPKIVVVVGDVNSTIACSLVASKAGVRVAHVEAGLRSFDRSMPEEINRVLTDRISDLLFVTEDSGLRNLANEGVPEHQVFFVGNVMIDSLVHVLNTIESDEAARAASVEDRTYALCTMHRPSNVDDFERLQTVVDTIASVARELPVYLPLHPRTRKSLVRHSLLEALSAHENVHVLDPLGYLEFLKLMTGATVLITDSGGIQEETTYLRIPCLTVRENTERPVTCELGSNELVPLDVDRILDRVRTILAGRWKESRIPPLWDGHAGERIADVIAASLAPAQTVP